MDSEICVCILSGIFEHHVVDENGGSHDQSLLLPVAFGQFNQEVVHSWETTINCTVSTLFLERSHFIQSVLLEDFELNLLTGLAREFTEETQLSVCPPRRKS
jgi:hypothetical protein